MDVEQIAGAGGAIIRGVDIGEPLSTRALDELRTALLAHLVIVLPDQPLDLDALERFTDELGGRDHTPYVTAVDGRPYVIRVIKEAGDELNFANAWHSDLSYLPAPPSLTVLQAWDVPPFGGDTIWANQYLAYESLSDDVKERIAGLRGIHSAGVAYGTGGFLDLVAGQSSMSIEPSPDAYATRTHPLVIRHPETGRPALYASPTYTMGIEGMEPEKERPLLNLLFRHAVNENFTVRLKWSPGMVAIWDNRCTQHFAVNDYPGRRREMFRTSVRGSTPVAAS